MTPEIEMTTGTVRTEELAAEVDTLLNPGEPDGVFRDSPRAAGGGALIAAGLLLVSPPTPRPKRKN